MAGESGAERCPYLIKTTKLIIKVIVNPEKEKYSGIPEYPGHPFAPVEGPEDHQRNPYDEEYIDEREIDQRTHCHYHAEVIGGRFTAVALIKIQEFEQHPYQQKVAQ